MTWVDVIAVLVMTGAGIGLVIIDLRDHRLPNTVTLPLFAVLVTVLALAAAFGGQWPRLLAALLGAVGMALFYLVLALLPAGMGMGDVKLALSIGLLCGWWSMQAWMLALILAFAAGAIAAVVLVWLRRLGWHSQLAFGPFMLLGWLGAAFFRFWN